MSNGLLHTAYRLPLGTPWRVLVVSLSPLISVNTPKISQGFANISGYRTYMIAHGFSFRQPVFNLGKNAEGMRTTATQRSGLPTLRHSMCSTSKSQRRMAHLMLAMASCLGNRSQRRAPPRNQLAGPCDVFSVARFGRFPPDRPPWHHPN